VSLSPAPIDQARQLYAQAREEKRLEGFHRRRARERMEAVRRFCEEHGIAIEIMRTEATGHGPGHEVTTTHR
jgi:hypothetical protein